VNIEVKAAVPGKLRQHVVEKADAGGDAGNPRTVEIKRNGHASFIGASGERSCAVCHVRFGRITSG
jgi:hypothetical protein